MKKFIRCKVCNYIMEFDSKSERCPACGVTGKIFEEYKYNISEKRRIIMELDLHPVMLHFPQAITVLIPMFILISCLVPLPVSGKLISTVEIIAYILPLSVAAALITGIFDGKNRFKKSFTPLLVRKIYMAMILQILSAAILLFVYFKGVENAVPEILSLSIASLVIQIILARIGIKLMFSHTPGK